MFVMIVHYTDIISQELIVNFVGFFPQFNVTIMCQVRYLKKITTSVRTLVLWLKTMVRMRNQ
jgi:hypothetical protein